MALDVKRKLGPLPIWVWGVIGGIAVYYVYSRRKASATATNATTGGTLDPNQVDPNTGLTYGAEEGAALNATAGTVGSSGNLDQSSSAGDIVNTIEAWLAANPPAPGAAGAVGPAGPAGPGAAPAPPSNGANTSPPLLPVLLPTKPSANAPAAPGITATSGPAAGVTKGITAPITVIPRGPSAVSPWDNPAFFNQTLGQVMKAYGNGEATARYLYAKGYRAQGKSGQYFGGGTYVYVGPKGKSKLPNLTYKI
jgi:hypothetical protein